MLGSCYTLFTHLLTVLQAGEGEGRFPAAAGAAHAHGAGRAIAHVARQGAGVGAAGRPLAAPLAQLAGRCARAGRGLLPGLPGLPLPLRQGGQHDVAGARAEVVAARQGLAAGAAAVKGRGLAAFRRKLHVPEWVQRRGRQGGGEGCRDPRSSVQRQGFGSRIQCGKG